MSDETPPSRPQTPGPQGHFLFGSSREFFAARLRFLEELNATYGVFARYRLGCDWHYLVNDPQIARAVLRDWEVIDNARADVGFELDDSFIAKNGHERAKPRRIVHSTMAPGTIASNHERMVQTIEATLDGWRDQEERDLLGDMMHLNVDVISTTMLGRSADSWLSEVMPLLTDLQLLVGAYATSSETVERLGRLRRPEVFEAMEAVVTGFVEEIGEVAPEHAPALDILLRACAEGVMTRRQMIHEICVLLTSSAPGGVAAMWTLYCLTQHAEARERLEAEVDALPPGPLTSSAFDGLAEVTMFVMEALRQFPPQGIITRGALDDWVHEDREISKNSGIDMCLYLLHRHPEHWREPGKFRPQRFDPESDWHHPDQGVAYMPFGLGAHRCIGEGLARHFLQTLVVCVVRSYRLELSPEFTLSYDFSPLGVLHPDTLSLPVRVHRR